MIPGNGHLEGFWDGAPDRNREEGGGRILGRDSPMRITRIKYLVDLGMGVMFLACFLTGIVKWPGFLQVFGLSEFLLPLNRISLLHDRSGFLLGVLVFAHHALNWKWVVATTRDIIQKGW